MGESVNGVGAGGAVIGAGDVESQRHLSLCEAVDRLLNKGVVLRGEVAISVAGVELVYLGVQVLLASTDTARAFLGGKDAAVCGTRGSNRIVEEAAG
jgi:hypothetical protein